MTLKTTNLTRLTIEVYRTTFKFRLKSQGHRLLKRNYSQLINLHNKNMGRR